MAQAGRWSSPIPPEKPGPRSSMAMAHDALAHIIHEHFCCNREFAAATSLHAKSVAKNLSAAI
jgi:hypothetical protein